MLRKITKLFLKIILWTIGVFITLDLLIVVLLFVPPIQQYVVLKVSKILTNITGGEITVDKIYLSPTLTLTASNFAIKDHHHNNMIFASKLKGKINIPKTVLGQVCLAFAHLDEGEVMLRKYSGEEKVNIAIWAQGFKKEEKKEPKFKLLFDHINLKDVRFVFINDDKRKYPDDNSIDYAFFELQHIYLDVNDFLVFGPDISCKINFLTTSQHTGFEISSFSGDFRIFSQGLTLDSLQFTTPNSVFNGNFALRYNDFPDFADFVNKINFDTKVKNASISMHDIVYFVPKLKGMDSKFVFSGYVGGTVNHLQTKNFYAKYKLQTHIAGDFAVDNLLDFKNSSFNLCFKDVNVNFSELAQLKLPKGKTLNLPPETKKLTYTRIRGNFRGNLTKFCTNLALQTNLGTLNTAIKTSVCKNKISYTGTVTCNNFELGKVLNQSKYFDKVYLNTSFVGEAKNTKNLSELFNSLSVNYNGNISNINLCCYSFKDIDFIGNYEQKKAEVTIISKDTMARFSVNGKVNFSAELPVINASVSRMNLKLFDFFSYYQHQPDSLTNGFDKFILKIQKNSNLSFATDSIMISMKGNCFDNLNGYIGIDNAKLTNGERTSRLDRIRIYAINLPNTQHYYQVHTNAVNISFKTNYEWKDCVAALTNAAYFHLPDMFEKEIISEKTISSTDSLQFIDFDIQLFYTQNLLNLLMPKLNITRNSSAHIHIGKLRSEDSFNCNISQVSFKNLGKINNLILTGKVNEKNLMEIKLHCDSISVFQKDAPLTFSKIDLLSYSNRKKVTFETSWRNPGTISVNELNNFSGLIYKDTSNKVTLKVRDSKLFVRNSLWKFTGSENLISFGNKEFIFDHCVLTSDIGKLSINGEISKQSDKECKIFIEDFDISILNTLSSKKSMSFGGDMFLMANINSSAERFAVEGKTFVKQFAFNDEIIGDLFLDATILNDNNLYFFGGIMQNKYSNIYFSKFSYSDYLSLPYNNELVGLSGKFVSQSKELRVNAKIDSLKIGFLSPFLSSFSNVFTGTASGDLDFIIVPDSLYFNGKVNVKNAKLGITPLNTVYNLTNQEILFDHKGIDFDNVILTDDFNNKATLNGFVHHNKFKDFQLELNISTPRILALNTPKKVDVPFFGNGFVSGDITIQGDTKLLSFSSHNIRTLPGSVITFPLSSASTVTSSKGIYFVESKANKKNLENTAAKPTAMNFDFVFDITRDMDVKLELDQIDGLLKCKTSGRLRLTYNSIFNDMNLNGLLSIVSGKFNMSLKKFFPRDFAIVEGGTIAFSGPITSAQLNVSALYKRAASLSSLSPLLSNVGRTDVYAYLGLTGNLMNPTPTFTFEFPRLTTENQMNVFTALDTANQQNGVRQFFSFVFLNTFISSESNINASQQSLGSGIDFVSGILNSFISNQVDNLSVGVNYISDQDNYREYSVNAALNFYDNRLRFNTNLGFAEQMNSAEQSNSFVGDVNMEYLINDYWRFRAFFFNDKTGSDASKPQQGGGVGISFKKEFNNRKDFIEKSTPKKKAKKQKK